MEEIQDGGVSPAEKARKVIEDERTQRVEACRTLIGEALKKHDCELHSVQEYIDGMPKGPSQVIVVGK